MPPEWWVGPDWPTPLICSASVFIQQACNEFPVCTRHVLSAGDAVSHTSSFPFLGKREADTVKLAAVFPYALPPPVKTHPDTVFAPSPVSPIRIYISDCRIQWGTT